MPRALFSILDIAYCDNSYLPLYYNKVCTISLAQPQHTRHAIEIERDTCMKQAIFLSVLATTFFFPFFAHAATQGSSQGAAWFLASVATVITAKSFLELVGIIPHPNKALLKDNKDLIKELKAENAAFREENKELRESVIAASESIDQLIKLVEHEEFHGSIKEMHELLSGQIKQVCQVETGKRPPAWCNVTESLLSRFNRSESDALLAQNSHLVVSLLENMQNSMMRIEGKVDSMGASNGDHR